MIQQAEGTANGLSLDERRQQIDTVYQGYKTGFPEVHDISAAEVKELLAKQVPLVFVDVRSSEEQQVSKIKDAIIKTEFEKDKERFKSSKIIVYCTAGGRSGKYAAQLEQEGFTDVLNLKGSLISWSHEVLPLVAGDGSGAPTLKIHAFGSKWATLCAPEYEVVTFANPNVKGATGAVKNAFSKLFGGSRK